MADEEIEDPHHEPCAGCGAILDVTTFGPFESALCPHCDTKTKVKRTFGHFILEEKQALGGMSVIFRGRDTMLDRVVAIKVLNEDFSQNEVRVQAFEQEARVTAQINHPNVVEIYQVGRAYGRFYLVMELLEGRSFEKMVSAEEPIPETEVLKIALQVVKGLRAAHKSGIIHRDVKPGNIYVDSEGNAKLLDFGLALVTEDGQARAEEIWATPFYVPPEALEGGTEDFRSDIYALGATLYHALAGHPPFESTSTSNSFLRKVKQTVPRLTKIAKNLSPKTGVTIDKMMAYQPEDRWDSYDELLEQLRDARRDAEQRQLEAQDTPKRKRRRSPNRTTIAALAGVALLALLATILLLNRKSPTPPPSPPVEDIAATPPAAPEALPFSLPPESETTSAWTEARQSFADQQYLDARDRFSALAENPSLSLDLRNLAHLEAAIASYLSGRPSDARKQANLGLKSLADPITNSRHLSKIKNTFRQIKQAAPPAEEDFPAENNTLPDALSTLLLSLKAWEQSQIGPAIQGFDQCLTTPITTDYPWFEIYQKRAASLKQDGEILQTVTALPAPTSSDQVTQKMQTLNEALDQLQNNGRGKYNIRAYQTYLARLRKGFEDSPPAQTEGQ